MLQGLASFSFLQEQVQGRGKGLQGQGQGLPLREEEEGSECQNFASPDPWAGLPLYRGTGTQFQGSSLLG